MADNKMNITVSLDETSLAAINALTEALSGSNVAPSETKASKPKEEKKAEPKEEPKEEEPTSKYTRQEVREALKEHSALEGREASLEILKKYAPSLAELAESDFEKIMAEIAA